MAWAATGGRPYTIRQQKARWDDSRRAFCFAQQSTADRQLLTVDYLSANVSAIDTRIATG